MIKRQKILAATETSPVLFKCFLPSPRAIPFDLPYDHRLDLQTCVRCLLWHLSIFVLATLPGPLTVTLMNPVKVRFSASKS